MAIIQVINEVKLDFNAIQVSDFISALVFFGIGTIFIAFIIWGIISSIQVRFNRVKHFEIGNVDEIRTAANYRTFEFRMKAANISGLAWSIICFLVVGFYVAVLKELFIEIVLVGLLLFIIGLFAYKNRNRTGLILTIIADSIFGGWILVNCVLNIIDVIYTITAMVNGKGSFINTYMVIATIVSIIWTPVWLSVIKQSIADTWAIYKEIPLTYNVKPTGEALRKFDSLKKTIYFSNYRKETDSIRFITGGNKDTKTAVWRGKLGRSYGLLISTSGQEFQIIQPAEIEINQSPRGGGQPMNNQYPETIIISSKTFPARIDRRSLERIKAWKKNSIS
jgi:hypothetical protein